MFTILRVYISCMLPFDDIYVYLHKLLVFRLQCIFIHIHIYIDVWIHLFTVNCSAQQPHNKYPQFNCAAGIGKDNNL